MSISKCTNKVRITKNLDVEKFPDGIEVNCGKCIYCRVQKKAEWSMRLLHESEFWNDSLFLTLTYNKENVPTNNKGYATLRKKDLQNFFKRIRVQTGKKIKYFACGEYGEDFGRPHYHAIVFGLGFKDKQSVMDCWQKCDWEIRAVEEGSFGLVEPDSINYVSKYIEEKKSGVELEELEEMEVENVFKIQSQGLGKRYIEKYIDKYRETGYITVKGKRRSIPRYYLDKAKIDTDSIKENAEKKEKELVNSIIKKELTRDMVYRRCSKDDIIKIEDTMHSREKQTELNLNKKIKIKNRR